MYKVLLIENFDNNIVPINTKSKVNVLEFDDLKIAQSIADAFLKKNRDNYAKIWDLATNEVIFESKRNYY